jgi:hypothetical protein
MQDHPIFGVLLLLAGLTLLTVAYFDVSSHEPPYITAVEDGYAGEAKSAFILGSIFIFNGLIFTVLGYRKWSRVGARNGVPR